MTVVCDFLRCQFNVNHFCSQKLLSIYNGYCSNLIDKHGNPKNDWMESIGKDFKEEVKVEDGEYKIVGNVGDFGENAKSDGG